MLMHKKDKSLNFSQEMPSLDLKSTEDSRACYVLLALKGILTVYIYSKCIRYLYFSTYFIHTSLDLVLFWFLGVSDWVDILKYRDFNGQTL